MHYHYYIINEETEPWDFKQLIQSQAADVMYRKWFKSDLSSLLLLLVSWIERQKPGSHCCFPKLCLEMSVPIEHLSN